MNIFINNVIVKEDLDVYHESGCFTAHLETFIAAADSSGSFAIRLKATKENAMLSSINIVENAASSSEETESSSDEDTSDESFAVQWINKDEDESYECAFVQAGIRFYLLGGREMATQLDIYDYSTNTWTQGANLPKELNHFQALEYEGLIWVIGAFQSNNYPAEKAAEYVYVYDPASDVWMTGPPLPVQRRRGAGGLQVHNGLFYIVGGTTVGHSGWCVPWLDEYDPRTERGQALADAPSPRDHFQAIVTGDKLYAIGGRCTSRYSVFSDTIAEVDVYDFKTGQWMTSVNSLPDNLPSPRAGAAVAVLDGKVVVMGGESGEQAEAYDTVNELDTRTGKWSTVSPMYYPRHGTQAIVSGHGIYIAGGSPVRGEGHQKHLKVYNNDDAPIGVPSTAGSLAVPSMIEVPAGPPKVLSIQHVSGNQGVLVQSLSLSGGSAGDFILSVNATAPLLIGKGSSLKVSVEYIGNADGIKTQLEVFFSGNEVIHAEVVGRLQQVASEPTNPPTGPRSQSPSQTPSSQPSSAPSGSPSRRPSYSSPATTSAPPAPVVDLIVDSGAKDEDMPLFKGRTWSYRVFFDVDIEGTDNPSYFRSHRSGSSFVYSLGGFKPGEMQDVHLGFSEIWQDNCANGKRVMAIDINGEVIEPALDVFKEAAGCFTALVKSYTVPANKDGRLEISFTGVIEHPMVSYIEVKPSSDPGSTAAAPTERPTLRPSRLPTPIPTLRPSSEPSSFSSRISTSPASKDIIIDAGSKNEDQARITGSTWSFGLPNSFPIANTETPSLYRTH